MKMQSPGESTSAVQSLPRLSTYLPVSLVLMAAGWGGLAYLIFFTLPTLGMRWLFYFFAVLACTGTAMPIIAFLHLRFPGKNPTPVGSIVRQALWVGIYFPVLAWLQIARVLTWGLAILIALGLFIIEVSLTLRERSLWSSSRSQGE